MRNRTIAVTTLALAIQVLAPVGPARAADPVTVMFSFTGAEETWVVPDGVTAIHAALVGGRGGDGDSSIPGGAGALVEGDLAVTPGATLYVLVGGNGEFGTFLSGGTTAFNGGAAGGQGEGGGGGGGGASDIRTSPTGMFDSLGSRLIVAAGGGGGGGGAGGQGGAAGEPGGFASSDAIGGGSGQSNTGGAGGFGTFSPSGSTGLEGLGGDGGTTCDVNGCAQATAGGGGGGGGRYGGGGGASATSGVGGGGGGGGSSYTGSATNASVAVDDSGIPSVAITYGGAAGGGPASGTVDAIVTMAQSAVCLELSTTVIDFGTRQFGEVGAAAAPVIGVTNCSAIGESILVRGTDATGPGGAAWSLVTFGACQTGVLGTDNFRLRLESQAVPDLFVNFGTENATLQALGAGATADHEAQIDTPCPGSTGAGAVMSMQIVFTATEEAAP